MNSYATSGVTSNETSTYMYKSPNLCAGFVPEIGRNRQKEVMPIIVNLPATPRQDIRADLRFSVRDMHLLP